MHGKIIICLCLAGLGSRFVSKGYEKPKYLLPTKNCVTILEEIIENFRFADQATFFLILNNRNEPWHHEIQRIAQKTKKKLYCFYVSDTKGQAETANLATGHIKSILGDFFFSSIPILFHNGDTILRSRNLIDIASILETYEGVVDTFCSKNPQFSYVLASKENRVTSIAEKKVISDRASSGLYGFRSAEDYNKHYEKLKFTGEQYISEIYKDMLTKDLRIYNNHVADTSLTIVLGTPIEYVSYLDT